MLVAAAVMPVCVRVCVCVCVVLHPLEAYIMSVKLSGGVGFTEMQPEWHKGVAQS